MKSVKIYEKCRKTVFRSRRLCATLRRANYNPAVTSYRSIFTISSGNNARVRVIITDTIPMSF